MTDPAPEFIGAEEVAALTGLSLVTVYRAFRTGELRGWKFHGRWVTTRDEVRKWVLRGLPDEHNS